MVFVKRSGMKLVLPSEDKYTSKSNSDCDNSSSLKGSPYQSPVPSPKQPSHPSPRKVTAPVWILPTKSKKSDKDRVECEESWRSERDSSMGWTKEQKAAFKRSLKQVKKLKKPVTAMMWKALEERSQESVRLFQDYSMDKIEFKVLLTLDFLQQCVLNPARAKSRMEGIAATHLNYFHQQPKLYLFDIFGAALTDSIMDNLDPQAQDEVGWMWGTVMDEAVANLRAALETQLIQQNIHPIRMAPKASTSPENTNRTRSTRLHSRESFGRESQKSDPPEQAFPQNFDWRRVGKTVGRLPRSNSFEIDQEDFPDVEFNNHKAADEPAPNKVVSINQDAVSNLRRLKAWLEQGKITQESFNDLKNKLLSEMFVHNKAPDQSSPPDDPHSHSHLHSPESSHGRSNHRTRQDRSASADSGKTFGITREMRGQGKTKEELTEERIQLMESSFGFIAGDLEGFAQQMYQSLFAIHPSMRIYFHNTDMSTLHNAMASALFLMVDHIRNPSAIEDMLVRLGARHVGYGILPEYYKYLGQAIIRAFGETVGIQFTPAMRKAWEESYKILLAPVLRGHQEGLNALKSRKFDQEDDAPPPSFNLGTRPPNSQSQNSLFNSGNNGSEKHGGGGGGSRGLNSEDPFRGAGARTSLKHQHQQHQQQELDTLIRDTQAKVRSRSNDALLFGEAVVRQRGGPTSLSTDSIKLPSQTKANPQGTLTSSNGELSASYLNFLAAFGSKDDSAPNNSKPLQPAPFPTPPPQPQDRDQDLRREKLGSSKEGELSSPYLNFLAAFGGNSNKKVPEGTAAGAVAGTATASAFSTGVGEVCGKGDFAQVLLEAASRRGSNLSPENSNRGTERSSEGERGRKVEEWSPARMMAMRNIAGPLSNGSGSGGGVDSPSGRKERHNSDDSLTAVHRVKRPSLGEWLSSVLHYDTPGDGKATSRESSNVSRQDSFGGWRRLFSRPEGKEDEDEEELQLFANLTQGYAATASLPVPQTPWAQFFRSFSAGSGGSGGEAETATANTGTTAAMGAKKEDEENEHPDHPGNVRRPSLAGLNLSYLWTPFMASIQEDSMSQQDKSRRRSPRHSTPGSFPSTDDLSSTVSQLQSGDLGSGVGQGQSGSFSSVKYKFPEDSAATIPPESVAVPPPPIRTQKEEQKEDTKRRMTGASTEHALTLTPSISNMSMSQYFSPTHSLISSFAETPRLPAALLYEHDLKVHSTIASPASSDAGGGGFTQVDNPSFDPDLEEMLADALIQNPTFETKAKTSMAALNQTEIGNDGGGNAKPSCLEAEVTVALSDDEEPKDGMECMDTATVLSAPILGPEVSEGPARKVSDKSRSDGENRADETVQAIREPSFHSTSEDEKTRDATGPIPAVTGVVAKHSLKYESSQGGGQGTDFSQQQWGSNDSDTNSSTHDLVARNIRPESFTDAPKPEVKEVEKKVEEKGSKCPVEWLWKKMPGAVDSSQCPVASQAGSAYSAFATSKSTAGKQEDKAGIEKGLEEKTEKQAQGEEDADLDIEDDSGGCPYGFDMLASVFQNEDFLNALKSEMQTSGQKAMAKPSADSKKTDITADKNRQETHTDVNDQTVPGNDNSRPKTVVSGKHESIAADEQELRSNAHEIDDRNKHKREGERPKKDLGHSALVDKPNLAGAADTLKSCPVDKQGIRPTEKPVQDANTNPEDTQGDDTNPFVALGNVLQSDEFQKELKHEMHRSDSKAATSSPSKAIRNFQSKSNPGVVKDTEKVESDVSVFTALGNVLQNEEFQKELKHEIHGPDSKTAAPPAPKLFRHVHSKNEKVEKNTEKLEAVRNDTDNSSVFPALAGVLQNDEFKKELKKEMGFDKVHSKSPTKTPSLKVPDQFRESCPLAVKSADGVHISDMSADTTPPAVLPNEISSTIKKADEPNRSDIKEQPDGLSKEQSKAASGDHASNTIDPTMGKRVESSGGISAGSEEWKPALGPKTRQQRLSSDGVSSGVSEEWKPALAPCEVSEVPTDISRAACKAEEASLGDPNGLSNVQSKAASGDHAANTTDPTMGKRVESSGGISSVSEEWRPALGPRTRQQRLSSGGVSSAVSEEWKPAVAACEVLNPLVTKDDTDSRGKHELKPSGGTSGMNAGQQTVDEEWDVYTGATMSKHNVFANDSNTIVHEKSDQTYIEKKEEVGCHNSSRSDEVARVFESEECLNALKGEFEDEEGIPIDATLEDSELNSSYSEIMQQLAREIKLSNSAAGQDYEVSLRNMLHKIENQSGITSRAASTPKSRRNPQSVDMSTQYMLSDTVKVEKDDEIAAITNLKKRHQSRMRKAVECYCFTRPKVDDP